MDRSKLAETSELHAKRDKLLYEEEHIRRNQETNFRKIFWDSLYTLVNMSYRMRGKNFMIYEQVCLLIYLLVVYFKMISTAKSMWRQIVASHDAWKPE